MSAAHVAPTDPLANVALSSALAGVFRGRFCEILLPEEIGIDAFQAMRSPDERYRTAPLKGLWTRTRGGFYHDGRFATLGQVVDH